MIKQFNLKERYKLPYEYDFLTPVLSPMTVSLHYNGHFLKYYEALERDLVAHDASVNEISNNLVDLIRFSFGKPHLVHLFNNAGQIINHIYYFESFIFKEFDKSIIAKLRDLYKDNETLLAEILHQARECCFGSAWLWIVVDNTNNIKIIGTPNAFSIHNLDCIDHVLCCIDLWEHAYYLDYHEERRIFLSKIFEKTNLYQNLK